MHASVGSVPARNDSWKTRGQPGAATLPVSLIDIDEDDALGRFERRAGAAAERAHHELRPDRQRRLRAAQAERLIVVESDPDDGQQLRREADEPRVAQIVGRAGFAGARRA